jgi:hypothetical protein
VEQHGPDGLAHVFAARSDGVELNQFNVDSRVERQHSRYRSGYTYKYGGGGDNEYL